ncbi:MAG: hydrogen gas-evolving membrane-bound hydrogenase subunit E [Candidatus Nanopelagicales bacterium]
MLVASLALVGVTAAAVPLLVRYLGRYTGYPLALVFLIAAGLLLVDAPEVMRGETIVQSWQWVAAFDVQFTLRLNGLSLLFAMLVLGVGALVLSYAPQYLDPTYEVGRLYTVFTLFGAAMLGVVLSGDLILLLVFWEITSLSSFLLVAGSGKGGTRPAIRALVITGLGGLALFGAVVILALRTQTTNIAEVFLLAPERLTTTELGVVAFLIIVAAFTKSAQVPFHFWLPGAMVAVTPVSAYLHAATLVKAGIYLSLLMSPLFLDFPAWNITLLIFGLATAVFGAFEALRQRDLKALLAYSTISQLGTMVALVGVGTSAALGAAALLVAAHALFKATLFMLVGIVDREAGSRDLSELSGLWRAMPITAALTGLAAMSMAGVPPLVGFVAKEEAFYSFLDVPQSAWAYDQQWAGIAAASIAVLGAALTFAYSARIFFGAFFGPLTQRNLYEPSWLFLAPAVVPAVAGLVLGIWPGLLNGIIDRTTVDVGFTMVGTDLSLWHGVSIALGLSAIAITLGLILHFRRRWVVRFLGEEPPVPSGPIIFDRIWTALVHFGGRVGRSAHSTSVGVHLFGVGVFIVALTAIGLAIIPGALKGLAPVIPGAMQPVDIAILALLIPTVAFLARSRTTITALVLAGFVGLIIAVWLILLGAPDVALTLLLVEFLTVVVAAPVLARLPRHRDVGSPVKAAVAAVVVGAISGLAVWAFTGRRGPSDLSVYFLTEAEELTGGTNVVNTILVDFRGLDTLGEITVLFAAALGLLAATAVTIRARQDAMSEVLGRGEQAVLRVGSRIVIPLLLIAAAVLFWRGHDEPGGGFIAGLVAGAAVAVATISGVKLKLPSSGVMLAVGLGTALASAFIGPLTGGAALAPVKIDVPVVGSLTSSLIFDLGVLLIVVGLVRVALERLDGMNTDDEEIEDDDDASHLKATGVTS